MTDPAVFPIPERLTAMFIVAAPRYVPARIQDALLRQVDTPHGRLDLRIDVHPASTSPLPQLLELLTDRAYAGPLNAGIRRRIARSRRFIQIQCSGPSVWPPAHLFRGAFMTQIYAALADGIPVDLAGGWPVTEDIPAAFLGGPFQFAITDWVRVAALADDEAMNLRTVGLARLGCPELRIDHIPAPILTPWANILNGLARKLLVTQWGILQEEPEQAFRQLTNPVTLDSTAIETVIDCGHHHPLAAAQLHLHHDFGTPDTGPQLYITQPDTTIGARIEWLYDIADRLGMCAGG
jgi:hypothetical protein